MKRASKRKIADSDADARAGGEPGDTLEAARAKADLSWDLAVPLVTHPLMLINIVKAFFFSGLIMALLLSFLIGITGSPEQIPMIIGISFAAAGGIGIVGTAAAALIYRNRMNMHFLLNDRGARAIITDTTARNVSILTIILGVLAGKPGAVGTGLITLSDRDRHAGWRGVVNVRYHPKHHAISLANSWRTVLILFCTPENYEKVAAYVAAATARAKVPASAKINPIPKLLMHTVGVVLACVPMFVFDYPFRIDIFAPLLILCFALAMLWLIPIMAYVVWAGLAYVVLHTIMKLMETRTSQFGGGLYRAFEVLSGDDIALLVATGIGMAYLIWLSRGLMSGRVRSALGGDMEELDG
ncbi:MAG TPA: hypothetical protein PLQ11_05205 [Beijerinckiaceae bacterium]|nr:hypothetical protein [Beijerinckiaceae bacterium]